MWTPDKLIAETRWSRVYRAGEYGRYIQSRFDDGTATVTLDELRRDWHSWPELERVDFCQSFSLWGDAVPDRDNILRFLVASGDHRTWPSIAQAVARELPAEESIPTLRRWCETCGVGRGANYYQAVALSSPPEAHAILRGCLARVAADPGLMFASEELNWAAHDAVCCLKYLLYLGEPAEEFRTLYASLKAHPCPAVREDVARWLGDRFESRPA
jgi:hypothetical protein